MSPVVALHALALLAALSPPKAGVQDQGVVSGGLGKRLDAAVRELQPPFWGSVLVSVDGKVALRNYSDCTGT